MKRILLVAGVGLGLFTATMATSTSNRAQSGDYKAYLSDTTPKKDTSKKPKPDSLLFSGKHIPNR